MTINADSGFKGSYAKIPGAAPYTQKLTDGTIGVDTTVVGPTTVTLLSPTSASPTPSVKAGHEICVQDRTGSASVNNILIVVAGGALINGQGTATLHTNWASLVLVCDGTNWIVKAVNVAAAGPF
jgi:hypothetical protein